MPSEAPPQANAPPAICYQCGKPLKGVCQFCGLFFCAEHGGPGMRLCWRHWRKVTGIAAIIAVTVILLLILGTFYTASTRVLRQ